MTTCNELMQHADFIRRYDTNNDGKISDSEVASPSAAYQDLAAKRITMAEYFWVMNFKNLNCTLPGSSSPTPTPTPTPSPITSYYGWVSSHGGSTMIKGNLPSLLNICDGYLFKNIGFTVTLSDLLKTCDYYLGFR